MNNLPSKHIISQDKPRGFNNVFSRRTTGFHWQAKMLELNFTIRKTLPGWSNQLSNIIFKYSLPLNLPAGAWPLMCSSRKYPYSPHRREWNFLGGGGRGRGLYETKKCKEMYEA